MAANNSLSALRNYLEMPAAEFRAEWAKLTDQDKKDLKAGFETDPNTLTY